MDAGGSGQRAPDRVLLFVREAHGVELNSDEALTWISCERFENEDVGEDRSVDSSCPIVPCGAHIRC